jgi:hypothetical protein
MGGLAVVFGAFLLWVELLIRAAAVYVAVLFLPLALASLAWPAIAHWCRRLVDTLVALILSKFVIVSVLSLAAGALAGGTGSAPAGSTGGAATAGDQGSFTDVLGGAALLALAAFAPWALFRLLPFLESGAVGHLEGAGRRAYQTAAGPPRSLAQHAVRTVADGATGGASEVGMALASAAGRGAGSVAGGAGGVGAGGGDGGGSGGSRPVGESRSPAPELGPSSLEKDGVGTATPPGASVPMWPAASHARPAFDEVMREGGPDQEPSGAMSSGSTARTPGSRPDRAVTSKP